MIEVDFLHTHNMEVKCGNCGSQLDCEKLLSYSLIQNGKDIPEHIIRGKTNLVDCKICSLSGHIYGQYIAIYVPAKMAFIPFIHSDAVQTVSLCYKTLNIHSALLNKLDIEKVYLVGFDAIYRGIQGNLTNAVNISDIYELNSNGDEYDIQSYVKVGLRYGVVLLPEELRNREGYLQAYCALRNIRPNLKPNEAVQAYLKSICRNIRLLKIAKNDPKLIVNDSPFSPELERHLRVTFSKEGTWEYDEAIAKYAEFIFLQEREETEEISIIRKNIQAQFDAVTQQPMRLYIDTNDVNNEMVNYFIRTMNLNDEPSVRYNLSLAANADLMSRSNDEEDRKTLLQIGRYFLLHGLLYDNLISYSFGCLFCSNVLLASHPTSSLKLISSGLLSILKRTQLTSSMSHALLHQAAVLSESYSNQADKRVLETLGFANLADRLFEHLGIEREFQTLYNRVDELFDKNSFDEIITQVTPHEQRLLETIIENEASRSVEIARGIILRFYCSKAIVERSSSNFDSSVMFLKQDYKIEGGSYSENALMDSICNSQLLCEKIPNDGNRVRVKSILIVGDEGERTPVYSFTGDHWLTDIDKIRKNPNHFFGVWNFFSDIINYCTRTLDLDSTFRSIGVSEIHINKQQGFSVPSSKASANTRIEYTGVLVQYFLSLDQNDPKREGIASEIIEGAELIIENLSEFSHTAGLGLEIKVIDILSVLGNQDLQAIILDLCFEVLKSECRDSDSLGNIAVFNRLFSRKIRYLANQIENSEIHDTEMIKTLFNLICAQKLIYLFDDRSTSDRILNSNEITRIFNQLIAELPDISKGENWLIWHVWPSDDFSIGKWICIHLSESIHEASLKITDIQKIQTYSLNLESIKLEFLDYCAGKNLKSLELDKFEGEYLESLEDIAEAIPQSFFNSVAKDTEHKILIFPEHYLWNIPWSAIRKKRDVDYIWQNCSNNAVKSIQLCEIPLAMSSSNKAILKNKSVKLGLNADDEDIILGLSSFIDRVTNAAIKNKVDLEVVKIESASDYAQSISSSEVMIAFGHGFENSVGEQEFELGSDRIIKDVVPNLIDLEKSSLKLMFFAACSLGKSYSENGPFGGLHSSLLTSILRSGKNGIGSTYKITPFIIMKIVENIFTQIADSNQICLQTAFNELLKNPVTSSPLLWSSIAFYGGSYVH